MNQRTFKEATTPISDEQIAQLLAVFRTILFARAPDLQAHAIRALLVNTAESNDLAAKLFSQVLTGMDKHVKCIVRKTDVHWGMPLKELLMQRRTFIDVYDSHEQVENVRVEGSGFDLEVPVIFFPVDPGEKPLTVKQVLKLYEANGVKPDPHAVAAVNTTVRDFDVEYGANAVLCMGADGKPMGYLQFYRGGGGTSFAYLQTHLGNKGAITDLKTEPIWFGGVASE